MAKGEIKKQKSNYIPLHKRKAKQREMNAGGFYEGMPGCVINEHGHRKMLEFVVTPEGRSTSLIHAHPKLVKQTVQQALSNPMIKGVLYGAVVDDLFTIKNPFNWPLRMRYFIYRWWQYQKAKRKANRNAKQSENKEA